MDEHAAHPGPGFDERFAQEEQLLAAAEAQIERGDYVTLEAMLAWVDSVGTDTELPPPELALQPQPPVR